MKKNLYYLILFLLIFMLSICLFACNKSVKISFDTNQGNIISSVSIDKDGNVEMPTNPTKEGYVFDGWYFDNNIWQEKCDGQNLNNKLKNFTVYAKWVMKDIQFATLSGEYAVEKYIGNCTDVVIPKQYKNLPVTTIAEDAFANNNDLLSVEIPLSVIKIYSNAINDCNSVTILCDSAKPKNFWSESWNGDNRPVVWNCKINNIADDGFTYFTSTDKNRYAVSGDNAKFVRYMGNEVSYTLPETVEYENKCYNVSAIDSFAFADLDKMTSINLSANISTIGAWAFSNCKMLRDFQILSSVTSIGKLAFNNCLSITNLFIPSSVVSVGSEAFNNCLAIVIYTALSSKPVGWNQFWSINSDSTRSNTVYWGIDNTNFVELNNMQYVIQNGKANLSKYIGNEESVSIPSTVSVGSISYTVESIGDEAFSQNNIISTIHIPGSVSTIGYASFISCDNLSSINISSYVVSIGSSAFAECESLRSINIPASVTYIGADVFNGSNNTVINCEEGNKLGGWRYDWNYENGAPSNRIVNWGCNNITSNSSFNYVVHNNEVYLTKYKGISNDIEIPQQIDGKNVVSFGNIFQENQNLASISIPNTILRISDYAFYKCLSLTNVELPSSILSIGEYAFAGTSEDGENMSLSSIYLSYDIQLETIGSNAFAFCTELSSFNMPSSTFNIGNEAFYECTNLVNIVLRNKIKNIGSNAFYNCNSLKVYCAVSKNNTPVGWNNQWYGNVAEENIEWNVNTDQSYNVNFYYQHICDDDYELVTEERTGAVYSTVYMSPKTITNFTFIPGISTTSGMIDIDETLVLSLYYSRNTFTANFEGNNSTYLSGNESQVLRFGATIVPPVYEKAGYTQDGWNGGVFENINKNLVFSPIWSPNTDTPYKIEFYFENLNDDEYTLDLALSENNVGTTDTALCRSVIQFDHFTLDEANSIVQSTITADGNGLLKYKYKRNIYQVTFQSNGGSLKSGTECFNVKYGSDIVPPVYERAGYNQNSWSGGEFTNISEDLSFMPVWIANGDTPYSVEYYFENLNDCDYTKDTEMSSIKYGPTDSNASEEINQIDHFTFNDTQSIVETVITADGNGLIKIYYTRNIYTVAFINGGGTLESGSENFEVKYGFEIESPVYSRAGYTQDGWSGGDFAFVCDNLEITPNWIANTDTPYNVEYYFENLNDNDYTLSTELSTTKYGATDSTATEAQQNFDYYTYNWQDSMDSTRISADGLGLIKLYYTRNLYTVTFVGNNGVLESGEETFEVKYDSDVTPPVYSRAGYTQDGWNSDKYTGICENVEIQPVWIANTDTPYRVEYYFENLLDDEYTMDEDLSQDKTGTTDETVLDSMSTFEHFSFNEEYSVVETTITADGLGAIKYYFKRDLYIVTFQSEGGNLVSGEEEIEVKYGADVTPPVYTRTGYTQDGWLGGEFTEIEENLVITPVWNANIDTQYLVKYYFENIANNLYTEDNLITENLSGTTDTTASIETIRTFDHFVYNSNLSAVSSNIEGDGSTVLSIYYKRETYSVNFSANGGYHVMGFETQTVKYEAAASTVVYDKTGYNQDGWTVDITCITENIAPMPVWIAKDNDLIFKSNGGTGSMEKLVIKTNESANLTKNIFTRPGYNFIGWATSANGDVVYQDEALYSIGTNNLVYLYAVWEIVDYNATYYLNGVPIQSSNPSTYTVNSSALTLNPLTYRGYSFLGWFDNHLFTGNAYAAIPANSTTDYHFYAKLSVVNYTINYYLNGGQNNTNPASYNIEDANITLTSPTLENCTFVGWYDTNSITGNTVTTIKTSTLNTYNLYAIWQYSYENIDFVLANSAATVISYSGEGGVVTIPSSLIVGTTTFTVTKIGDYAFSGNCDITKVMIENGITTIGAYAFNDCLTLDSVNIPSTVTSIGNWAFNGCSSLKSVRIPSTVATMGEWAFANCSIMIAYCEAVSKPADWDSYWNYYTTGIVHWGISSSNYTESNGLQFVLENGKAKFTRYIGNANSVSVPNSISIGSVNYNVDSIGMWAFAKCSTLTSIVVPNNITSIGSQAFTGCSMLNSLTLPFVGASRAATGNSSLFGYVFGWTNFDSSLEITQSYRSGYSSKYYIPSSLRTVNAENATDLKYGAFSGCTNITNIILGESLVSIGDYAFSNCTSLSDFAINGTDVELDTIGNYVFENCSNLASITIPETVVNLGEGAFCDCCLLTINCEIKQTQIPVGWDDYWNISCCPVIWETE